MNRFKLAIAASILGACNLAVAQTPPVNGDAPAGDQPHRRGPPPEAIAACAGKPQDQACTFTNRKGDAVTGRCEGPRHPPASADSSQPPPLACRPNHAPTGAPDGN
jgi:hypothetical protein